MSQEVGAHCCLPKTAWPPTCEWKRFPWSDYVGCTYERKRLAGTNCVGCTCDRKQFRRIIVFLAILYVFPYLRARRSHTASFCRTCVPGGHIPDGFWVVWEGPPYHPHALGDGSKCRRGKGLKTVCVGPTRTSDYVWAVCDVYCSSSASIPSPNFSVGPTCYSSLDPSQSQK